jgi:hypothetical protein
MNVHHYRQRRPLHTGEVQGSIPCASTIESPVNSGLFSFYVVGHLGNYRQFQNQAATARENRGTLFAARSHRRYDRYVQFGTVSISQLCDVRQLWAWGTGMVDRIKRAFDELKSPACPSCRIDMKWLHSSLVERDAINHVFHCPSCFRRGEMTTKIEIAEIPPGKLSAPLFKCAA